MGCMQNQMGESLSTNDPELFSLIQLEKKRQLQSLEIIASENYPSYATLKCLSSCFNNTYSKQAHRNNFGNIVAFCEKRCLDTFGLRDDQWGAEVRAYSCSIANLAAFMALCKPHDRIMGLDLNNGGHYSHGYVKARQKLSAASIFYETLPIKLNPQTGLIDYDKLAESARAFSPKVIIAGVSCYSRCLDYKRFRQIADEIGAFLIGDIAHVAGLVATDLIESPFNYCDVVTTSTYKSLRGTKGSIIFYKKYVNTLNEKGQIEEIDLGDRIIKSVFPGLIGADMLHAIAAIASTMREAASPAFKRYQSKVLENATRLCNGLKSRGYDILTGGTDIHMMLVNLKSKGVSGAEADIVLEQVNISCNSYPVPGDSPSSFSNGLRIGTPALTTRGLSQEDIDIVTNFFDNAIKIAVDVRSKINEESMDLFKKTAREDPDICRRIHELKADISSFAENFPIPGMPDC